MLHPQASCKPHSSPYWHPQYSLPIFALPNSDGEREAIIRRQMAIFKKKRMTVHCLDPAKAYADVYMAGADAAKKYVERKVKELAS